MSEQLKHACVLPMSWTGRYVHVRYRPEDADVFQLVIYAVTDEMNIKNAIIRSSNASAADQNGLTRRLPKRKDLHGDRPLQSHALNSITIGDFSGDVDGLAQDLASVCLILDINTTQQGLLGERVLDKQSSAPSMFTRAKNSVLSPKSKAARAEREGREHLLLRLKKHFLKKMFGYYSEMRILSKIRVAILDFCRVC